MTSRGTPAVEAETESTDQVAVGRRVGVALSLREEFCSSGFSEGSLFEAQLEAETSTEEITRTKFVVISSGVIPMPLSVTSTFSVIKTT